MIFCIQIKPADNSASRWVFGCDDDHNKVIDAALLKYPGGVLENWMPIYGYHLERLRETVAPMKIETVKEFDGLIDFEMPQ